MPFRVGMDSVREIEVEHSSDALHEKRYVGHLVTGGEAIVHRREALTVARAVTRWDPHSQQEHLARKRFCFLDDLAEVFLHRFKRLAAERVVAAELHDQDVGILAQEPGNTGPSTCRGVATDAGVDQTKHELLLFELPLEDRRISLIWIDAQSSGDAVTQEDDGGARRHRGARRRWWLARLLLRWIDR